MEAIAQRYWTARHRCAKPADTSRKTRVPRWRLGHEKRRHRSPTPRGHSRRRIWRTRRCCGVGEFPFDVTLVDQHNYHLFQPLLYQVATAGLSPPDIASPIRAIMRHARNVNVDNTIRLWDGCLAKLVQGTVCKILNEQDVKPHKVRYYLARTSRDCGSFWGRPIPVEPRQRCDTLTVGNKCIVLYVSYLMSGTGAPGSSSVDGRWLRSRRPFALRTPERASHLMTIGCSVAFNDRDRRRLLAVMMMGVLCHGVQDWVRDNDGNPEDDPAWNASNTRSSWSELMVRPSTQA
jgi:hypothetical protein